MAFHVRDEATDIAVRKLAKLKGKSLTASIREHAFAAIRCPASRRTSTRIKKKGSSERV